MNYIYSRIRITINYIKCFEYLRYDYPCAIKLRRGPLIQNIVGSFLVLKLETKWRLFECFEVKQKTMFNTETTFESLKTFKV